MQYHYDRQVRQPYGGSVTTMYYGNTRNKSMRHSSSNKVVEHTRELLQKQPRRPLLILIVGVCFVIQGGLPVSQAYREFANITLLARSTIAIPSERIIRTLNSANQLVAIGAVGIAIGMFLILLSAVMMERMRMYKLLTTESELN